MSDINLAALAQNLNIATLEQLHLYTGILLNRLHSDLKVIETPGVAVSAAEFNIFTIADGSQRAIIRTSIAVDPTWNSDRSKKTWMFAQRLNGNVQIPASFLAN
jgi:hypothetical protein